MVAKPWRGQTVAVIASGPSLTQADCDLIESAGLTTVAVNSSWKLARFADVLYAGDFAWWKAYGHEVDIPAERWSCARQAVHHFRTKLHSTYGGEFNSGQRAIQFAVERGAARVILLGFDGSLRHGVHWHGPHEKTGNPDEVKVKKWRRQFALVASQAKRAGCEVVNCSRHTELTCFPLESLESALELVNRDVALEG